jgi:hypothetical protein
MKEFLFWIVTAMITLAGMAAAYYAVPYLPTFVAVVVLPVVLLVMAFPREARRCPLAGLGLFSAFITLVHFMAYQQWRDSLPRAADCAEHHITLMDVCRPSPWSWWPLLLTVLFAVLWAQAMIPSIVGRDRKAGACVATL